MSSSLMADLVRPCPSCDRYLEFDGDAGFWFHVDSLNDAQFAQHAETITEADT